MDGKKGEVEIDMGEKITRAKFIERTGKQPIHDDMERVNCPDAGKPGHLSCGWCDEHNLPQFVCCCSLKKVAQK